MKSIDSEKELHIPSAEEIEQLLDQPDLNIGEDFVDETQVLNEKAFELNFLEESIRTTAEAKDRAEIEKLKLENKYYESEIHLRKWYAGGVGVFLVLWSFAMFGILFLCGKKPDTFALSNGVIITLISGTTGSVIGLATTIVISLFPKKDKSNSLSA